MTKRKKSLLSIPRYLIFSLSVLIMLVLFPVLSSADEQTKKANTESEDDDKFGGRFWTITVVIIILPLASGFFSIILVAYMSMDELVLELKTKTGNDEEKAQVNLMW